MQGFYWFARRKKKKSKHIEFHYFLVRLICIWSWNRMADSNAKCNRKFVSPVSRYLHALVCKIRTSIRYANRGYGFPPFGYRIKLSQPYTCLHCFTSITLLIMKRAFKYVQLCNIVTWF